MALIAAEGCRSIHNKHFSLNRFSAQFFNRPIKVDTRKILSRLSLFDADFYDCVDTSSNSLQSAVVYHKQYTLVIFRESDQRADWSYNLDLRSTDGFHAGFKRAADLVWAKLERRLKAKNSNPIILSGFSLGGAIATALVPKLVAGGLQIHSIYTFGSPKVLLKSQAVAYDMQFKTIFFRFQNTKDLFTYLPLGLGYSHVGRGLIFDPANKKIQISSNDPSEFSRLCKIDHEILKNHSIDTYISALNNNV